MNITYESITVGFLLSVPVIVALYYMMVITVAHAISDVMSDYREPVKFSVPKRPVMLVEMHPSFVMKSYEVTSMPEQKMTYKSYQVEALV